MMPLVSRMRCSAAVAMANHVSSPLAAPSFSAMPRSWAARGSPARYTRWPKPGSLRRAASASSTNAAAWSGEPMSINMRITSSMAPPCNGPLMAPRPATTAEYRSASVPTTTRQANVEALVSCSVYRMSMVSKVRVVVSSGVSPVSM